MSDSSGAHRYRLVGLGDDGTRVLIKSGMTLEVAAQAMNEFTAYHPLYARMTIEDDETGEASAEWFRPNRG